MSGVARLGAVWIALAAAGAGADVVTNEYVGDDEFEFEIRHMPDLDQNRAGLGNDGQCHCVPTSTINALIYIANHGFPEVEPGPGFWDDPALYNLATAYIEAMGSPNYMDTSWGEPPEDNPCGTGSSGGYAGLKKWLEPYGIFVVGDQKSGLEFTPDFTYIAKSMMTGSIGTVTYGKYDIVGFSQGVPVVMRIGGHVMTPIYFSADANGREMWVRDPDDENPVDINTQTPFNTIRTFTVTTVELWEIDEDFNPIGGLKMMDQLTNDGSTMRLIDGHRWIRLKNGYTLTNDGHDILVLPPGGEDPLSLGTPSGTEILSMAPDPNGHDYYVITAAEAGGSNQMHRISALTGSSETIPAPEGSLVVTGPDLCYVGDPSLPVSCVSCADGTVRATATPPFPYEAMAMDDAVRELLLLSTTAFKLMRFPERLDGSPAVLDIPTTVALGGNPRLAVNPADGKVWVSSDASSTLYGLSESPTGGPMLVEELVHPLVVAPEGLDFDDRGHMFVATGGGIVELEPIPGGWAPVAEPLFGSAPADGLLHVARSRTNAVARHDTPAWMNIPHGTREVIGTPALDCLADLDHDDVVGILDFLILLGAWGPCPSEPCVADLDHDEQVGILDFLILLAAWGACP